MSGFTGNDAGMRKGLVVLLGLFSWGAWRQRRKAKREAKRAKEFAEAHEIAERAGDPPA